MPESLTLTRDWLDMFDGLLPDDTSRMNVLRAVAAFAFDGKLPENLTKVENGVFSLIRPAILKRERDRRHYRKASDSDGIASDSASDSDGLTSKEAKTSDSASDSDGISETSNQYRNTVYTPLSLDKSKEVSPMGENSTARRVFRPPTVEEVAAYCRERNNGIDPQAVIDFYESKGWMIGKNKMKDWKAAVRTWERRRHEESQNRKPIRDYSGI